MTATLDTPTAMEFHEAMPIGRIHPDPINPRTHVDVDDDFIASCAAGIHEPLIVRPDQSLPTLMGDAEDFLIVAGERRYTAATAANLAAIPVIVRHDLADDADALEVMIIENGQRESLPPLDEARAYATLVEKGRTQRDIAAAVGREQGTVSKRLSLLKLPTRAQQLLDDQRITVKTALGMTGLVKDNGRLSKVLDYAAQNPTADDTKLGEIVFRNLEEINRTKNAAKVEKAKAKKAAELKARGLTDLEELEDDPDRDDEVVYEDCDEADATAFQVWSRGDEIVVDWCRVERDETDDNGADIPEPKVTPDAPTKARTAAERHAELYPPNESQIIVTAAREYVSERITLDSHNHAEDTLTMICRVDTAWEALVTACGETLPDERLDAEPIDATETLDEGDDWERPGPPRAPSAESEPPVEPFKGYNAFPVKSIVNIINNDETTTERIETIITYETANRADTKILDAARTRLDALAVAS